MTINVLAVDDSRTMRDMIALALRDQGFDVTVAEDGIHGLEVLEDADPDVDTEFEKAFKDLDQRLGFVQHLLFVRHSHNEAAHKRSSRIRKARRAIVRGSRLRGRW